MGGHAQGEGRSITFVLPQIPPSINSLYQILYARRQVELKPEARRWKNDAKEHVPRFELADGATLRVDCEFNFDFSKRRFDSANLLKLVIDAIAEKLGINDKIVRHGSWYSLQSEREFIQVTLTEITLRELVQ